MCSRLAWWFLIFLASVTDGKEFDKDYLNAKGEDNYFFDTYNISSYTIDDPNYKLKTFKLGEMEFEDTSGFVDGKSDMPLDHKGYDEDVMRICGKDLENYANNEKTFTKKLSEYSNKGTAVYYPTTKRFGDYEGIDMIPESKDGYVRGTPYKTKLDFEKKYDMMGEEDVVIQRCKADRDDGVEGGWVVDRIGPFYATGGYDWWQIGWPDVGGYTEILEKHPEGFDIDWKSLVPVTQDGRRLGHPPIHIHHIHIVPMSGVRPRCIMRNVCMGVNTGSGNHPEPNCYNSSLFFEQHGDYQCKVEDDGIECLNTRDRRRIRQPLDIEGEVNDVRPAGSEQIKFYFQAAFRWSTMKLDEKPVSQTTIMAPAYFTMSNQLDRTVTFPTPTHAEHMLWYTGRMTMDGEMYRNKLHAHNMVFESSEFYVGEPRDFGLDQPRMMPRVTYESLQTKDLGFKDNDDFRQWIMNKMEESQRLFDQNCVEREHPEDERCGRPRPRVVCVAKYDSEVFKFGGIGYHFDRRPKTWCQPWKFREGDAYTVVGFSRHLTEAPKPDKPGFIPATIPGHISWHMWFFHDTFIHSYFNRVVCTQTGIFYESHNSFGVTKILATVINGKLTGGLPPNDNLQHIISSIFAIFACLSMFLAAKFAQRKIDEFKYKKIA